MDAGPPTVRNTCSKPIQSRLNTHRISDRERATYLRCRELVTEPALERHRVAGRGGDGTVWLPDNRADREFLDICADEVLERDALAYAHEVMEARDALANWVPDA